MTEQEAIERIRYRIETASNIAGRGVDRKAFEDLEMAIDALEELQQCRALGTVEELREAREKQVPKKAKKMTYDLLVADGWEYACPSCGCAIGENRQDDGSFTQQDDFCPSCGQAIDWSDTE